MCNDCSSPTRPNTSALFAGGVCAICGQPRTPGGEWAHAAIHLQRGEALVEGYGGRIEVKPMRGAKIAPVLPQDFYRRVDPKLRKLIREKLANRKRSQGET